MDAKPGDLLLIMSGDKMKTRKQLCELRLEWATVSACATEISSPLSG